MTSAIENNDGLDCCASIVKELNGILQQTIKEQEKGVIAKEGKKKSMLIIKLTQTATERH